MASNINSASESIYQQAKPQKAHTSLKIVLLSLTIISCLIIGSMLIFASVQHQKAVIAEKEISALEEAAKLAAAGKPSPSGAPSAPTPQAGPSALPLPRPRGLTIAGSSEPSDDSEWPMFHRYLNHTGYTDSSGPITNRTLWIYTVGDVMYTPPAVAGGVVYFGCDDNNVYAINAIDGSFIWNYTTGGIIISSPAVADGIVYIGSYDNNVYALDSTNGSQIWNYTTEATIYSSPSVADGIVYIGSADNSVYALNATNGNQIWNYTTGDIIESSPAVAGGIVYIGSYDDNIYALNATNGDYIWNYTTGGNLVSSPAVADGIVYIGAGDSNIYALNATNGSQIWNYTTGDSISYSSPAVAGGIVYIGSTDQNVYALNATNGSQIWNYTTGDDISFSPAVAGGIVYIGSYDDNIYALNATNGSQIWNYSIGVGTGSSPAIASGVVYVSSFNKLYAFGHGISSCQDITYPGDYTLDQNITGNQSSGYCIDIQSDNVTLDCDGYDIMGTEISNYNEGIHTDNYSNIIIKNCIVHNYYYGISALTGWLPPYATNNTIYNNTVYDTEGTGISINCQYANVTKNIVYNSTLGFGIGLYTSGPQADYGLVENNTVYDTLLGFGAQGIDSTCPSHSTWINNIATNNTRWDFYFEQEDCENNTVINLTTNDTTSSFTFDGMIHLKAADGSGISDLDGYSNIKHYLNITNGDITYWIFINISYQDSDMVGVVNTTETKIFKYSGGEWWLPEYVGDISQNGINEDEKYVYANITNFSSIYAPMGPECIDNDGDGFGSAGFGSCLYPTGSDCDDNDNEIHSLPNSTQLNLTHNLKVCGDESTVFNYSSIDIDANDIVLDCNNSVLDGIDGSITAINANGHTNITIENCNIDNYENGIHFDTSSGSITNCSIDGGGIVDSNGILLEQSDGVIIDDNNISDVWLEGIYSDTCTNINITNNVLNNTQLNGVHLLSTNDTVVWNNEIYCNYICSYGITTETDYNISISNNNVTQAWSNGLYLNELYNSTASLNNITSSNDYGIEVETADYSNITDNFVYNSTGIGSYIGEAYNCNISGNTVSLSSGFSGLYVWSGSDNILNDNIINDNTQYGIVVEDSTNTNLTGNEATGNALWDYQGYGNGNENYVFNLLTNDTTSSFTYDGYISIKSAVSPADDPSPYVNISHYLEITNDSEAWIYLNVSYASTGSVDENTLKMWRYNGTDWSQVSGENGVDPDQNYVYANITEFSDFAPMGEISGAVVPEFNFAGLLIALFGGLCSILLLLARKKNYGT